jgi:putative alpha-1,2-mannosidase
MLVSNFAMAIYVESVTTARAEQVDGMACLVYDSNAEVVEFRVATSFISHDQATVSLHREAPTGLGTDGMNAIAQMSFDEVAAVAKGVWNKYVMYFNPPWVYTSCAYVMILFASSSVVVF